MKLHQTQLYLSVVYKKKKFFVVVVVVVVVVVAVAVVAVVFVAAVIVVVQIHTSANSSTLMCAVKSRDKHEKELIMRCNICH